MKDKIFTLIIGMLIGAIITSIGFVIYMKINNENKISDSNTPPQINQNDNETSTLPSLPSGNSSNIQNNEENSNTQNSAENSNFKNDEKPPELPNGEAPNQNGGTPPALPNGETPNQNGGTPPALPNSGSSNNKN